MTPDPVTPDLVARVVLGLALVWAGAALLRAAAYRAGWWVTTWEE